MRLSILCTYAATMAPLTVVPCALAAQDVDPRIEALKAEALELVEGRAKLVQEIVDQLFSFGELGFQEFETQRYLTGLLADNGFEIELGVAGMPSAWTARWGSGRPVIALGSDVDGIPQSLPDGQGQVDSLQLSTAGRIEVIRGPAASLYGSAAGGVIRIESEPAPASPRASGRIAFGSHGYRGYDAKSAGQVGAVGYLIGLSRLEREGHRQHSRMETNVLNSRVVWDIDDRSELAGVLGFVYSPISDDPGGLTAEEARADPSQARDRNLQFDAGERLNQLSMSLRYRRNFAEGHETRVSTYFGRRDFSNKLPFDGGCREAGSAPGGAAIELDRFFGGGSLSHVYSDEFAGQPNRLLVGLDVELQRDDRMRRCNYGSWIGRQTLDQSEEVTSVRGFVQDEFALPADFEFSFSLGYDALFYRVDDRLAVTPGDPDDSGRIDFGEFSPMGALRWSPDPALNAWTRISTSFEPPTTTELRGPGGGGGFNPDLGAQRAVNYEVGIKGALPEGLDYEFVVYHIRTDDELVGFELGDETFFRNAGRTHRTGLESTLRYAINDFMAVRTSYTFTVAEFADYVDVMGQDLKGNAIPGVPEHFLYTELTFQHGAGLFASLEARYAGTFFADDANEVEIADQVIVDFRLGFEGELAGFRLTPYIGVNNFFDRGYMDNIRVNASAQRYYEPAAGIEVYGGMGVSYGFGKP